MSANFGKFIEDSDVKIKPDSKFSLSARGNIHSKIALASFVSFLAFGSLAAQGKISAASVTAQQILEVENARSQDVSLLIAASKSSNPKLQQAAVRAMGRMERASLRDNVLPLMKSPNARIRTEAANALGQINAQTDYNTLISAEKNGAVRAELFRTVGRVLPTVSGAEQMLATGLSDASPDAQTGASRGLESLFRLNRGTKPSAATVARLHEAFVENSGEVFRELALMVLTVAGDKDSATFAIAMRDTSAQVRRVAVLGTQAWVEDSAPMVRYQALRAANACGKGNSIGIVPSDHELLASIDLLGDKKCLADQPELLKTIAGHVNVNLSKWRLAAHAIVSLAKLRPDTARFEIPRFANSTIWQVRVYAATASRIVGDTATLHKLAHDPQPNVAIEAMSTTADALRALTSNHAGLVRAGALKLKGSPALQASMPQIVAALDRLSKMNRATTRDPRIALLERIAEGGDASAVEYIRPLLRDVDPAIAKLAAAIISAKSGTKVAAKTTEYAIVPVPSATTIAALQGATATIVMRSLGTIRLDLYADDAPLTVAKFAELADQGAYNGLTFHRIVPNFVIQGGSPGADEYDGITRDFMRDEIGLRSHLRGTLGISTRGHDTGDGQIFINLVDNFRLDHQYTVFA
ncbi:MAG: peptidylprolyl isomerase, partial [Gemmatimonadaceae bacterium]